METKRKNKLLKVAVGRLQVEYDKLKQKYKIADSELQFVNQLTKQIERVQNAGGDEDDANTFNMTKVTDDGASRKSAKQDDKPVSQGTKSINLPDVTVKDPFLDPEITT